MIRDSLTYLTRSDDAVKVVLIGALLSYFGALVVPVVLVAGYNLLVLRRTVTAVRSDADAETETDAEHSAERAETPPTFENWTNLAVLGMKAGVVKLVFTTIPVVVLYLLGQGALDPGEATGQLLGFLVTGGLASEYLSYLSRLSGVSEVASVYASFEPLVLFAIVSYVFPAALTSLAEENELRAAFDPDQWRQKLTTPGYAVGWALYLVYVAAGWLFVAELVPRGYDLLVAFSHVRLVDQFRPFLGMALQVGGYAVNFALLVAGYRAIGVASVRGVPAFGVDFDRQSLLFGTILLAAWVLVVPAILVVGYFVRSIRAAHDGQAAPPPFEHLRRLFVTGLKGSALWLGYALVPYAVFHLFDLGVSLNRPGGFAGGSSEAVGNFLWLSLGATVGPPLMLWVRYALTGVVDSVLFLVFTGLVPASGARVLFERWDVFAVVYLLLLAAVTYLVPVALASLAKTDSLRAALVLADARHLLRERTWFVRTLPYWAASTAVTVAQLTITTRYLPAETGPTLIPGPPFGVVENVPLNVVSASQPLYAALQIVPSLLVFYLLTRAYLVVGRHARDEVE